MRVTERDCTSIFGHKWTYHKTFRRRKHEKCTRCLYVRSYDPRTDVSWVAPKRKITPRMATNIVFAAFCIFFLLLMLFAFIMDSVITDIANGRAD